MPKAYVTRNAFNSGEISPLIAFRDDISKYNSACLILENLTPLVEGGAKKMPGTYYAGSTKNNAKSRLVPFQFSTAQGAILEFSAGIVRVWEAATQGSWSLGLVIDAGGTDYNPATAYVLNDVVKVGSFNTFLFSGGSPAGTLFIASPYGQNNATTVPVSFTTNSADALSVTVNGITPTQGINIALANATAANNASSAIQAAIRALGSLNSPTSNYIDLSAWTVTPDLAYYATPWITAPNPGIGYNGTLANWIGICTLANHLDEFPVYGVPRIHPPGVIITPNSPYWDSYTPSGLPLELSTPYAEADLFALDCSTQSADVLWIFHPNYPPAVVERLSANLWKYSTYLPGITAPTPPYRGTLDVVKTGYSGLGQSITGITAANPCVVTVAGTGSPFQINDRVYLNLIGGMVELNQGEYQVDSPVVNGDGTFSFSLTDPDTGIPVDSSGFIAYVSGGFAVKVVPLFAATGDYPACGTLYQERLCVGGSYNNPTQMNGSVQDDYPDFITDPNADDYAIQFTLVSNKLDQIVSMLGTPNCLIMGTAGGVWVMAGSNGTSLSQTNVDAAKQTNAGVSALQPQLANDSAIFVSRSSRIVLFLVFDFVSNQWNTYDLTRLNRNITLGTTEATSGISQTAFQTEPYPIFWCVRNDGQLIGLVFNKQDQVYAWFRINMQGGLIESVAVISGDNIEDQVAVVVNRTINGSTVRYVEYFMPQELFGQLSNAFFVNCGQQLQLLPAVNITGITNANPPVVHAVAHGFSNGMNVQISGVVGMASPTQSINQDKTEAYTVTVVDSDHFSLDGMDTTAWSAYASGGTVMQVSNQVTGMSYLLGQTVTAVGDGAVILLPTAVTSDSITFPYYCNLITIGIPYQVTLQPTNPVLTSQGSTTRGMKQKLNRVTISLYQSMGGECGTDLNHMYDITYGPGSQAKQPAMSTLELTRDLDGDWSDESTFYITQSEPLPFTVRGLVWRESANQD